jgi:hypothetical protein
MMQIKHEVYKITRWEGGCVRETERICPVWLDCWPRTQEEDQLIAKHYGGDILTPTTETRIIPGPRKPWDPNSERHQ